MKKQIFLILGFMLMTGSLFAEDPQQKFQGFNLQGYTENGTKSWEVSADTADIIGSKVKLNNVDGNSYGEQQVNIISDVGVMDQGTGNMHLESNVVITSEDGTQLVTDSLDWNKNEDLVTTQDDVLIVDEQKGFTVTGTGMKAQPGLKYARIHKDVEANIDIEPEKNANKVVTITCDGPMVIEQAKSFATFEDNVVAIQEGQTLKADRMEIYFDGALSTIKEVICIGNVVVVKGGNKTYAQKMVYDAVTEKMVLSGRPKLILLTEGGGGFAASGD